MLQLWKAILPFCAVLCSVSWVAAIESASAAIIKDCKCADSGISRWDCKSLTSADQLCIFSMVDPQPKECHLESPACNVRHLQLRDSHINFELRSDFTALQTVDFFNVTVECSVKTLWLLNTPLIGDLFKKLPQNCSSPKMLIQIPVDKGMNLIRQVNYQCPKRCICALQNVPTGLKYVTITINCTNQGFTELPQTLPSNVYIYLDLSNNQVRVGKKLPFSIVQFCFELVLEFNLEISDRFQHPSHHPASCGVMTG